MTAAFAKWAAAPPAWASSASESCGHTVLSSRVRVARNLARMPFPHNAPPSLQGEVLDELLRALPTLPSLTAHHAFRLETLSADERAFLMERQLISHEHAQHAGPKGLIVTAGEAVSIMINEEDHIRAACFAPGLGLDAAWERLSAMDDELAQRLDLSHDPDFGFLTAWPTNLGTALRASCLLHLPSVVLLNKAQELIDYFTAQGLAIRGFYGEGTSAIGDLFQVSNARTLGRAEGKVLESVGVNVKRIALLEADAQASLLSPKKRVAFEDRVYRALALLQSARLMPFPEAMQHLSLVRLGAKAKLDVPVHAAQVTELFFLAQPAHLRMLAGSPDSGGSTDGPRADLLRRRLG